MMIRTYDDANTLYDDVDVSFDGYVFLSEIRVILRRGIRQSEIKQVTYSFIVRRPSRERVIINSYKNANYELRREKKDKSLNY